MRGPNNDEYVWFLLTVFPAMIWPLLVIGTWFMGEPEVVILFGQASPGPIDMMIGVILVQLSLLFCRPGPTPLAYGLIGLNILLFLACIASWFLGDGFSITARLITFPNGLTPPPVSILNAMAMLLIAIAPLRISTSKRTYHYWVLAGVALGFVDRFGWSFGLEGLGGHQPDSSEGPQAFSAILVAGLIVSLTRLIHFGWGNWPIRWFGIATSALAGVAGLTFLGLVVGATEERRVQERTNEAVHMITVGLESRLDAMFDALQRMHYRLNESHAVGDLTHEEDARRYLDDFRGLLLFAVTRDGQDIYSPVVTEGRVAAGTDPHMTLKRLRDPSTGPMHRVRPGAAVKILDNVKAGHSAMAITFQPLEDKPNPVQLETILVLAGLGLVYERDSTENGAVGSRLHIQMPDASTLYKSSDWEERMAINKHVLAKEVMRVGDLHAVVSMVPFAPVPRGHENVYRNFSMLVSFLVWFAILAFVRQAQIVSAVKEQIEEKKEDLDQFASIAAHDLKSPLNAIATNLEWLEEDLGDVLDNNTRGMLRDIDERVAYLRQMSSDLLAYYRADSQSVETENVNVSALVDDLARILRGGEDHILISRDRLPVLETARAPLSQILQNLIGNAINHGMKDDIHIHITAVQQGAYWRFAVSDNGRGIPPEHHDDVFLPFRSIAQTDDQKSTGMGLAIIRRQVTRLGGEIGLSEGLDGRGVTIWFDWPDNWPRDLQG